MIEEVWKDVVGYEGLYFVSNTGKICSNSIVTNRKNRWGGYSKYTKKGTLKSFFKKENGYLCVHLYKDNKESSLYVHRIVAEAFIDNPLKKEEVNHKDFNKENNSVENLEWCSTKENIDHAIKKYKRFCNGKKIICVETGIEYENSIEAGKELGISSANIRMALSKKTKNCSAGGYHWKNATLTKGT